MKSFILLLVFASISCKSTNQNTISEIKISDNSYKLPLLTCENRIVDSSFQHFKIVAMNMPGASDRGMVPYGLDVLKLRDYVKTIKNSGFNTVRLPYADIILDVTQKVPDSLIEANLDGDDSLKDMTPLDVFLKTIEVITEEGLLVYVNSHSTMNMWCCKKDDRNGLWDSLHTRDNDGGSFISSLVKLANLIKNNPNVIGFDIRNEIREDTKRQAAAHWSGYRNGSLMSQPEERLDWKKAAENAAEALLAINPDWLMIIEGLNFSIDFKGIKLAKAPVNLSVSHKLIYSPHAYSFHGRDNQKKYNNEWGYLMEPNRFYTAPLMIGEFGDKTNSQWWKDTVKYIKDNDISFTYWSMNAERYGGEYPKIIDQVIAAKQYDRNKPSTTCEDPKLSKVDAATCIMNEVALEGRDSRTTEETYGYLQRNDTGTLWVLDTNSFRHQAIHATSQELTKKLNEERPSPKNCKNNFGYRWMQFANSDENLCLEVTENGGVGAPVSGNRCHSGRNQQWLLTEIEGKYQVQVRYNYENNTKLCLSINKEKTQIEDCNNSVLWQVKEQDEDSMQLSIGNRCLWSKGSLNSCEDGPNKIKKLKLIGR